MHQLITGSDTSIPAVFCYTCRLWWPLPCHKWVWLNWYLSTLGWRWTASIILRCLAVSADASSNQTCHKTLFIHKTICCLRRNWSFFVYIYTVFQKKTCDHIFYNNFNNKCPITIIFGIVSLCVIERWFHFPLHLSSATTLPWEITEHKKWQISQQSTYFCQ